MNERFHWSAGMSLPPVPFSCGHHTIQLVLSADVVVLSDADFEKKVVKDKGNWVVMVSASMRIFSEGGTCLP